MKRVFETPFVKSKVRIIREWRSRILQHSPLSKYPSTCHLRPLPIIVWESPLSLKCFVVPHWEPVFVCTRLPAVKCLERLWKHPRPKRLLFSLVLRRVSQRYLDSGFRRTTARARTCTFPMEFCSIMSPRVEGMFS